MEITLQNLKYYNQEVIEYVTLNPESLTFLYNQGRNILFYHTIKDCYKDLLVERFPHSLECVDNEGKNILFHDTVGYRHKKLFIEKYPSELARVNSDGYFHVLIDEKIVKILESCIVKKEGTGTCAICLCDFEIGDIITNFNCKHNIHRECDIIYSNNTARGYVCYCIKK